MKQGKEINAAEEIKSLMDDLLRWQPEIEKAAKRSHNQFTFNGVVGSILRREKYLFSYDDCFVITQVDQMPDYRNFHCYLAGGTTEAILSAEPELRQMAEDMGCRYLTLSGRYGWQRRLKSAGWKPLSVTMYKEVS